MTGGKPCFKGTRLPIEPVLSSLEKGILDDHVLDEYSLTSEQLTVAQVEAAISCGRRTHGPDVWRVLRGRRDVPASMQELNQD
ncbi:DUF433 domain-containing protein [Variovorax paradoxus]|uniref:DUF433 domain-containing protein n=1 Tax=Variovorax paradoxus TaxID=34073 RepID=UPI000ABD23D7|nr:DUF433 domain-containing protein [Variovorax paradoxus]